MAREQRPDGPICGSVPGPGSRWAWIHLGLLASALAAASAVASGESARAALSLAGAAARAGPHLSAAWTDNGTDPIMKPFDAPPAGDAVEAFDATGIPQRSRRPGEAAPDVTLPDAHGRPVRLSDVWRKGPLVLVFYRGGWCSYCSLQLREWHRRERALQRLGATLLAVSPQTPENSLDTADDNRLGFTVLSDSVLEAANGFGLAFTLHPDLVDFYGSVGTDIPVLNGNGLWVLPVPATFVIDPRGTIRFAAIAQDVRRRVEPADVLSAIEAMSAGAARPLR